MNVAFIRWGALPLFLSEAKGTFGGAEVRAATFAEALASRTNHRVSMIVRPDRYPLPGECDELADPHRVRVAYAPCIDQWQSAGRRLPLHQQVLQLKLRYRKLSQSIRKRLTREPLRFPSLSQIDADVICTFGVQKPTPSIVKSARETGRVVVLFLTSDADTQAALLNGNGRQRDLRDHRYAILNSDLVIAQTETQRRWVEQFGQAVSVVKNPIDTQVESLSDIDDRKYMLWVGRADADCKRADLLIQVAMACPRVPFVAVMNPTDAKSSESLYRRLPLNVELVEHIDFASSDAVYRDALALINTSDSEGFPNAFLQAFKFGVPVLSRRVNPDGVLTRQQTGFVAHDDLDHLAAMVRQLYEQPGRFRSVARSARNYVVDHHEVADRVDELDRLLCELHDQRATATRVAA